MAEIYTITMMECILWMGCMKKDCTNICTHKEAFGDYGS